MSLNVTLPNIVSGALQPPVEMAQRDTARRELVSATHPVQPYVATNGVGSYQDHNKSMLPPVSTGSPPGGLPPPEPMPVLTPDRPKENDENASSVNKSTERNSGADEAPQQQPRPVGNSKAKDDTAQTQEDQHSPESKSSPELTQSDLQQLEVLRKRDREVRRHEMVHASTGGGHTGVMHLSYTTGPDGKQYAVSGEVEIDISPVPGDPTATIAKMQQIRRAATAPSEPSSQDREVANQAASIEREARAELAKQRQGKLRQQLAELRTLNADDTSALVGKQQEQQWVENMLPDEAYLNTQLRSEVIEYRYISSALPARIPQLDSLV